MRTFLDRRADQRREDRLDLHRRAEADARRIVELIRSRYEPHRIVQWGSLLDPESFREYSDIDIALEGITEAETFFRLLAEAEQLTSFDLDIVQLERIEPEYRDLILRKGKVLYERPR
ncbi:MAG: nucleotidyltransferase domain-containing protein [Spirochaetaceae bacterium]|nr:MAG: nucleotidyltransferase domain-containing protein [Spirochaetaceae bacterium]